MKRLGFLFGGAFVALMSCSENKGSLQIRGVLAPPVPMNGACLYDPQPTSPTLFSGTLDLALNNQYTPALLISNQMVQRANSTQLRVETNNVSLEGATVRITDAVGNQLANYTTTGSGFVSSAMGMTPGFGTISVTMIDANTVEALRPTIPVNTTKRLITYVKVFGRTLGGLKIETAEFQYPVDVTNGGLVVKNVPDCSAAATTTTNLATPCVTGQDQYIDCRLCYSIAAACR